MNRLGTPGYVTTLGENGVPGKHRCSRFGRLSPAPRFPRQKMQGGADSGVDAEARRTLQIEPVVDLVDLYALHGDVFAFDAAAVGMDPGEAAHTNEVAGLGGQAGRGRRGDDRLGAGVLGS